MTVSTSRAARQQRIVEILSSQAVRSQTALLDLLAGDGIEVTQATLARPGRRRCREGQVSKNLVYAVPSEGGDRTVASRPTPGEVTTRLAPEVPGLLVSADPLRESGRAAHPRAGQLPRQRHRSRLGAGHRQHHRRDDTIMVITTGGGLARGRRDPDVPRPKGILRDLHRSVRPVSACGAARFASGRPMRWRPLSKSTHFDWRLAPYDLAGSRPTHVSCTPRACSTTRPAGHARRPRALRADVGRGVRAEASDEDVHTALERASSNEPVPTSAAGCGRSFAQRPGGDPLPDVPA